MKTSVSAVDTTSPLITVKAIGPFTRAMMALQPGTRIGIRGPFGRGFRAVETWLGSAGAFCHGDAPTLADCYLVPQVYNAERFECGLDSYPRIREITARCRALDAFARAAPEAQADADS